MSGKTEDVCDDYGFHFLDDVAPAVMELMAAGRQSRNSSSYYWDNISRQEAFLFQYTLGGSGTVEIEGKPVAMEKGTAFFLKMPGEERYYFDEAKNAAPWEFVYVMLRGMGVEPYYEYAVSRLGKVMTFPEFHPVVKLLLDIHCKARNGLIHNGFTASSEVCRFLCLLCDKSVCRENRLPGLIDSAKTYMELHYKEQITLAQAADALGVSGGHLSREFVKATGEQAIHYLTRLRLEQAVRLLTSTEMNTEEIGRQCGFLDGNYFGKVFKKYMRISPGRFRRQAREQGFISVRV